MKTMFALFNVLNYKEYVFLFIYTRRGQYDAQRRGQPNYYQPM